MKEVAYTQRYAKETLKTMLPKARGIIILKYGILAIPADIVMRSFDNGDIEP